MSSQDVISSKSKKRQLAEDDELGNVISQSFDNISMEINRAIEVMAKCFSEPCQFSFCRYFLDENC